MPFKLFDANIIIEKHRQHLHITLKSIGDAVIATDISGNVTNINPAAEHLTGWSFESALGKPLHDVFNIINTGTREIIDNPVKNVLETGEIMGLANHTVLISKDGYEYQIADSAAPIKDSDGTITGVVLVFKDVTKEYKLKEDLLKSEKKYRLLFESLIEGVCLHEIIYNDSNIAINYISFEILLHTVIYCKHKKK
jgi:PAS domain S-box-containing protein